jgi:hypothetical protein
MKLFESNANETLLTTGKTDLGISTEYFDRTFTLYIRNKQYYGKESLTNEVQLNFNISGCDLVPIVKSDVDSSTKNHTDNLVLENSTKDDKNV